MNREEAKEYLKQIRKLDKEIDCLILEKESYRILAEKKTASFGDGSAVQQNGNESKVEKWATMIVDAEKEIDEKIEELVELKDKIRRQIALITDPMLEKILILRYIHFFKYQEIADIVGIDISTVFKYEKKALDAVIDTIKYV